MTTRRFYNGRWRIVGFEYIQAFEFLVQHRERLELLRLVHLHFKPVLDFILLYFLEVGVGIVQMSMRRCENGTKRLRFDLVYRFSCNSVIYPKVSSYRSYAAL